MEIHQKRIRDLFGKLKTKINIKKIILLLCVTVYLTSCSNRAEIDDNVIVEQINILEGQTHKYEVKLKTKPNTGEVYLYTDFRFQVSDSLISYYEFFEGKNQDIRRISMQNDSLRNELKNIKYYLEILKERVIFDTLKKR